MTEVEFKVYESILTIRRILSSLVDSVDDAREVNHSIDSLDNMLRKVVGRRIINESKNNAR